MADAPREQLSTAGSMARPGPSGRLPAGAALLVGLVAVAGALVAGGARIPFLIVALAAALAAAAWGWAAARSSAAVRSPAAVAEPAVPAPAPARPGPGRAVAARDGVPGRRTDDAVALHLGRRAQALITRQLDVLRDGEGGAEAAELARLAARLRHNAESLLLAAGAEPPQRWRGPVAARDLARAAVAESEAVGRVRYQQFPPVAVAASSVGAVVHVLVELLDQAARTSPPDGDVAVAADLDDDDLVLVVRDRGVGLDEDLLDEANVLLGGHAPGGTAATAVPYVIAGRAAAAAGIDVLLDGGAGGVRAVVRVPAAQLEAAPAPAPSDRGVEHGAGGERPARARRDAGTRPSSQQAARPGGAGPGRPPARDARPGRPPDAGAASRPGGAAPRAAERTERRRASGGAPAAPGGLERRIPGASWSGPPELVTTPAFGRRGAQGQAPHLVDEDGHGDGPGDGLQSTAEARRARLDRFSSGRATAEALIELGQDDGPEQKPHEERE